VLTGEDDAGDELARLAGDCLLVLEALLRGHRAAGLADELAYLDGALCPLLSAGAGGVAGV